jgi:hypothetical protein
MIGLLDSTNSDVSPEGLLPQGHVADVVCLRSRSLHEASLAPSREGLPVARLRRFLNGWVVAAIAYRERQAALLARRQLVHRKLDNTRIYCGPIDEAFEKAAQLRKRWRLKQI